MVAAVAANPIENTVGEFVTPVTSSPTASMSSPTAGQKSPVLERQQSMEMDCLPMEGATGVVGEVAGSHDSAEDESREEQTMVERCVCMYAC